MKARKIFVVFSLFLVLTMALAACAKATPVATEAPVATDAPVATEAPVAADPLKITLSFRVVDRAYLPSPDKVAQEIQAQLAEVGVEVTIKADGIRRVH